MKKKIGRKFENLEKQNLRKTLFVTFAISFLAVILAMLVQLNAQSKIELCSYLDPIVIDIFALIFGLFLVIEGLARIYEHPNASLKRQFTRIIRVAMGFAILTLHIIQFVHK